MTPLLAGKDAVTGAARTGEYARHRPEQTLLYQLVEAHYPGFVEHLAARDRTLPAHVQREFEDYLKCGRLEHGFLRVRCADCHAERLVAFSCKRRGFCASCGTRGLAVRAALFVNEVLPREPIRQWVLSVPFALRYLFATHPAVMGQVLGSVYRAIASHLIKAAGYHYATAQTGAVTLIQWLSLTTQGNIRYRLKTPYRDGTTDVVFEPLDFMARLAALVPTPQVNLTRDHGVFAPNHRLREQVTPARRGRHTAQTPDEPALARQFSMTWAQRLQRVFKLDILTCEHCGGAVTVLASIEDPAVIKQILDHLDRRAEPATPAFSPFARAPPPHAFSGMKEPG